MSTQLFVRLPDDVWNAIREFEPFAGLAALSVDIRAKVAEAPKVEVDGPQLGVVRVVVLASDDADELLEWLGSARTYTTTLREACQTAMARVRQAQRLLCSVARGGRHGA